ncbi:small multi-drug export protein [archaeon]|nr:small multi-drug export protein [archaeon]
MFSSIIAVLFSVVPGVEAMWSSAMLICLDAEYMIPLAIILNFAATVVFLEIVDRYGLPRKVESFIERKVNNRIKKFEKWFSRYAYVVIFILVGLPFTGVGSYTGAFIGRVLGLKKPLLFVSILLGIILSVTFSYMIIYGVNTIGIRCDYYK